MSVGGVDWELEDEEDRGDEQDEDGLLPDSNLSDMEGAIWCKSL